MTSTSFNVGLGDDTRSSSRVLRPPGGGHTDIFGGEPEPPRTGRRQVSNIIGLTASAPEKPVVKEAAPEQNGQAEATPPAEPVQETANSAGAAQEITEAPEPAERAEPAKPTESAKLAEPQKPPVETTRRVRVPPGGFSSGLW